MRHLIDSLDLSVAETQEILDLAPDCCRFRCICSLCRWKNTGNLILRAQHTYQIIF